MKSHHLCQTYIGSIIGFLLVNSIYSPSAVAGRYVFNQMPKTIERYFGRYITKQSNGDTVTYTYAPQSFWRLFSQFTKAISRSSLSTIRSNISN
ncbi:MAG: hypothetical protein RM347_018345 [Nostoc sp. ChiQUE02]|uniref:hypothetical protein n=1 Tax=Nostoc sp. ChiQUE02 TaxID=3075377 RepID=UPI002AD514B4|nr:hypothetical protein [Nostoc sp. ChiQUE02]MDZ8233620.1 hypothetical protein [Nostoc sp. ChiQUE02]